MCSRDAFEKIFVFECNRASKKIFAEVSGYLPNVSVCFLDYLRNRGFINTKYCPQTNVEPRKAGAWKLFQIGRQRKPLWLADKDSF